MSRQYRISRFPYIALLWIFALLPNLPLSMPAFAQDPMFTVEGIVVDVTAKNAVAAREEAFNKAQQEAFTVLAERLMPVESFGSFEVPEPNTIATMVNDFEITNEQLSTVRYIGTYTFRFRDSAVRKYFSVVGISYSDVVASPVLVLPWYQVAADKNVLWDQNNPWLAAWRAAKPAPGLVPSAVPAGDAQDLQDIPGTDMMSYDPAALANIVARYKAGEAVIALAAPVRGADVNAALPSELNITLYHTANEKPVFVSTLKVGQNMVTADGMTIYDAGVKAVRGALAKAWKERTATAPSDRLDVTARVYFTNMNEWIDMQAKLRRISGMQEARLISLKPGEALVAIKYDGGDARLRAALEQMGMALTAPAGGAPAPSYDDAYNPDAQNVQQQAAASSVYEIRAFRAPSYQPVPAPAPAPQAPANNWRQELYYPNAAPAQPQQYQQQYQQPQAQPPVQPQAQPWQRTGFQYR